nr:hypothetical protein [uncultured Cohaesibacter sp.]
MGKPEQRTPAGQSAGKRRNAHGSRSICVGRRAPFPSKQTLPVASAFAAIANGRTLPHGATPLARAAAKSETVPALLPEHRHISVQFPYSSYELICFIFKANLDAGKNFHFRQFKMSEFWPFTYDRLWIFLTAAYSRLHLMSKIEIINQINFPNFAVHNLLLAKTTRKRSKQLTDDLVGAKPDLAGSPCRLKNPA